MDKVIVERAVQALAALNGRRRHHADSLAIPGRPAPDAAYSDLACHAMQRIAEVCPSGALKWAREAHPALTDKIDVELLARLDGLWNSHAPIPDFESALQELVSVHAEVGKLFKEHVGLAATHTRRPFHSGYLYC